MINDKLVNYYLLCSIGTKKIEHMLHNITTHELESILSKKEQKDFLKTIDDKLFVNEKIIGGESTSILEFILE